MGAFIVAYIAGSFVAIPVLAYHLLRTRRDLNGLRAELVARGVVAPHGADAHAPLAAPRDGARPLGDGAARAKPPYAAG